MTIFCDSRLLSEYNPSLYRPDGVLTGYLLFTLEKALLLCRGIQWIRASGCDERPAYIAGEHSSAVSKGPRGSLFFSCFPFFCKRP